MRTLLAAIAVWIMAGCASETGLTLQDLEPGLAAATPSVWAATTQRKCSLPELSVDFDLGPCSAGARACTKVWTNQIFVAPDIESKPRELMAILAHELGHVCQYPNIDFVHADPKVWGPLGFVQALIEHEDVGVEGPVPRR